MGYYDALTAKWDTLTGTTAEKLTAVNALTVAGPNVDVQLSAVVGYLSLNAKLAVLQNYAQTAVAATNGATTASVTSAKELVALIGSPNAPAFQTSNATVYGIVETMLAALVADANSGLTSADQTALLALAATTVPWWQASVAEGGGSLSSPITQADLDAAGGLS